MKKLKELIRTLHSVLCFTVKIYQILYRIWLIKSLIELIKGDW